MPGSGRSKSGSRPPGTITVLAGVNGAGKSSIAGAMLREAGGEYFNPDEAARRIRTSRPSLSQTEANAEAWQEGKRRLEQAIRNNSDFTFETTLGGATITRLLLQAAASGMVLAIWYAGLSSIQLHVERVAARVKSGGHNIPEADIRRRWTASHANLIRLLPAVTRLNVFDNSAEADPAKGVAPQPQRVLTIEGGRLVYPAEADLPATPDWAKPIVMAAWKLRR